MKKLTCLLAACSIFMLHTFAQEAALRRKADDFMRKHKAVWNDMALKFYDSTMLKRFRNHSFYKAYSQFLKDNGNDYMTLRTARFRQYNPPPATLKAFAWEDPQHMKDIEQNADLMSLAFLRSFDPGIPAEIVMSILVPSIAADNDLPALDVRSYYQKRAAFGTQLYAAPIGGDIWQVWCADRTYACNFTFNLRKGSIGKMQYADVRPIEWPASVVQPLDDATGLRAEMMRALWNNYQSYDQEKESFYMKHRREIAGNFYHRNQARFIAARKAQLKPFLKPKPALADGFKELTKPGNDILLDTDTAFNSYSFIYPEQWENSIEMAAGEYFDLSVSDRSLGVQRKSLFGIERYVQLASDDRWEIWTVSDNDVIHYVWDLRTGRVDNIRYWVR